MYTFFVVSLWEYLGQDYTGPGDTLCHVFWVCHAHQLLCLRRSCQLLHFIRYCQRNQFQVNIINWAHTIIQCQTEGCSIKLVYYREGIQWFDFEYGVNFMAKTDLLIFSYSMLSWLLNFLLITFSLVFEHISFKSNRRHCMPYMTWHTIHVPSYFLTVKITCRIL